MFKKGVKKQTITFGEEDENEVENKAQEGAIKEEPKPAFDFRVSFIS